jgi:hypothetical protein
MAVLHFVAVATHSSKHWTSMWHNSQFWSLKATTGNLKKVFLLSLTFYFTQLF